MSAFDASPQSTNHFYTAIIASPIGKLGIKAGDDKLISLGFLGDEPKLIKPQSDFVYYIMAELEDYFHNPGHQFKISLDIKGTPFQQKVWKVMQEISVGNVLSYGALAQQLHTSPRAIGNACRANFIPIIIPCHRIVACNGLGGFSGKRKGNSIAMKTWLLHHEGYLSV